MIFSMAEKPRIVFQKGQKYPQIHREVVSYVRRGARMNDSQQKAWNKYSPQWVISVPERETSTSIAVDAKIDLAEIFGRTAPLIVEIGSGNGACLIPQALANPGINYLSFEVFQPSVASMLSHAGRAEISNLRVIMANGVEGLERLIPKAAITELWTFFPDPWHKTRHHKRRLINRDFGSLVASRLADNGLWRIATDWQDYADWIATELTGHPLLEGGIVPRWDGRVPTKYEQRGLKAGREIHDFRYRHRA